MIVVLCSSYKKEEIPLEQKILGEWNLDLVERTVLKDDVFAYQSTDEPVSPLIYSFAEDKKFAITDVETGYIRNSNDEWLAITEDAIVFKNTYFFPNVNKCTVEKITNTSVQ